jgi:hypothetical protein
MPIQSSFISYVSFFSQARESGPPLATSANAVFTSLPSASGSRASRFLLGAFHPWYSLLVPSSPPSAHGRYSRPSLSLRPFLRPSSLPLRHARQLPFRSSFHHVPIFAFVASHPPVAADGAKRELRPVGVRRGSQAVLGKQGQVHLQANRSVSPSLPPRASLLIGHTDETDALSLSAIQSRPYTTSPPSGSTTETSRTRTLSSIETSRSR